MHDRLQSERPCDIAAMYPGAIRTTTPVPDSGRPVGFGFILSREVLESIRGVMARYQIPSGAIERHELGLSHDFLADAPVTAPFSATWTSTLLVPSDASYRLRLDGPSKLVQTLDGVEAVRGGAESSVHLARDVYALRVEGSNLGREPIGLLWAPPKEELKPVSSALLNTTPVDPVGLLGRVYQRTEPAGDPVVEQVDPNVELRVHVLPTGRPYTLEWTGALRTDRDGRYTFGPTSLGAGTLWIDGAELARKDVAEGLAEGTVELRRGWHDIQIRFVDTVGFSRVTAFWQPPGAQREPIPPSALRPWPADRMQMARPEDANLP